MSYIFYKAHHKQAALIPPIFLSLTHTLTLFLSFKMPRGANKCQAVPVHWWLLSPRPDKQGCRLAGRAPRPPPPLAAPPHCTQAAGSWEKERPTDQQLLWLWLSDWPGCCTPPSPRSGHLTLGKLTNAWPLGAPADWRDPEGVMTSVNTHTHIHTTHLQQCSQSRCLFKHLTKYIALPLTHTFQAVWLIVMEMEQL